MQYPTVWNTKLLVDKTSKEQNASARLLKSCSKYAPSKHILKKLHWLPIRTRIKFSLLLQAYKGYWLSPPYITDMLFYEIELIDQVNKVCSKF